MKRGPVLLLIAATALAFGGQVLIYGPQLRAAAGGLAPFDLRIGGYGAGAANDYLAALSGAGKTLYLGPVRLLDTLFPMLMAGVLLLPLGRRAWRGLAQGLRVALGLPALAYGLCDLGENAAISRLLRADLPVDPEAVRLASLLTQAKFLTFGLAVLVALALLGLKRRGR